MIFWSISKCFVWKFRNNACLKWIFEMLSKDLKCGPSGKRNKSFETPDIIPFSDCIPCHCIKKYCVLFSYNAEDSKTCQPSLLISVLMCDGHQVKWGISALTSRAFIHSTVSPIHFQTTDHYSSDGRQMVMNWRWYRHWAIWEAVSCTNCYITFSQWCSCPVSDRSRQKLHPPPPTSTVHQDGYYHWDNAWACCFMHKQMFVLI